MEFNAVFNLAEVTILGDIADFNNFIMLVLSLLSIIGLVLMKKWGAALAESTLSYAFAFNIFNIIYFEL